MLRYGESLTFFDTDAIGSRVFYDDLGTALVTDGIGGLVDRIDMLLKEYLPGLIVIDSFKAINAFAADATEFRRFLHGLAGRLTSVAADAFWIGEYQRDAATDGAASSRSPTRSSRWTPSARRNARRRILQILKLRGSDFRSGEHAYRVTASGIVVFPRLADTQDTSSVHLPIRA